ncbi:hypothetical protein ACFQ3P_00180 [Paraburkholderia sabiae]|uniref:Lipoprotein n=1 Tax=Paraburkholderia sabiae TaxID=273251 RepID=A0ABU9Q8K1_9BURK|nr:hypothetical protein [Paraburkholderia sabiae]WJZ78305.1 hypothetical protein QEN71_30390 [Paraburkholderia sabiae]CAD6507053.1 hypothetical protein LMG24235_00035 [Paraburkholderia sabiae]
MNLAHIAVIAVACVALVACTRKDSVFSLAPNYTGRTVQTVSDVAGCIAERWRTSARHLREVHTNDAVRLEAQSLFHGVPIGVRLRTHDGDTLVEYFQRRVADPIYRAMVKECTRS